MTPNYTKNNHRPVYVTILFKGLFFISFLILVTRDVPLLQISEIDESCQELILEISTKTGILQESFPLMTNVNTSPGSDRKRLRILQYNVQFLLPEITLNFVSLEDIGHWPSTAERARGIGEAIGKDCYDIIALNESVNKNRRQEIVKSIEEASSGCISEDNEAFSGQLYTIHGPKVEVSFKFDVMEDVIALLRHGEKAVVNNPLVGDELTIISRFPIIDSHSLIYSESAGIDTSAAKGVLHARIWLGGSYPRYDIIDVFSTHLQAGNYPEVRQSQIEELAEFVGNQIHPSIPVIIMGDFNIDGLLDEQREDGSSYNDLMLALNNKFVVKDTGKELFIGTNRTGTRRIDYVFVSSDFFEVQHYRVEKFPCTNLSLSFCNDNYPTLSDHAAVSVELTRHRFEPITNYICGQ